MSFIKEYERLNKEQRQAVDNIDGPLLVIAGPGTGKTQLLAMRVANILTKTDTDASSILCLTFTNKAATNMRRRILDLTRNKAVDVTVKTFHSFASEIMNIYPDRFWSGAKLTLAPDALQLEIVQNILFTLPLDNPLALKFAGKYTLTDDIMTGLKLVKEAGLTPEKLKAIIDHNLAYIDSVEEEIATITDQRLSSKLLPDLLEQINSLDEQSIDEFISPLVSLSTIIKDSLSLAIQEDASTNKTKSTGEWKRRWVQTVDGVRGMHQERSRNKWWLELASVYSKYRSELHTRGYYDYSDMIVEVIAQLESDPAMRADAQERFSYVMIDEFQDTNAAQMRLAHLIADHHVLNDNPNLMVVGDDDQSIFKFNGAELSNMLSFQRTYPKSKTIVLSKNYRSTQEILDSAKIVIENASDRLVNRDPGLAKNLRAESNHSKGVVELIDYPDRESQLSGTAREIHTNYKENTYVAVLARSHSSLRELSARLLSLGVPVHYEQQRNALDHPLVTQALAIMHAVDSINNGDIDMLNVNLSKTLRHAMWKLSDKKLWMLALDNTKDPNWLKSLENDKDTKWISTWLMKLARLADTEPLPITIECVLGLRPLDNLTSPIRDYFAKESSDKYQYLSGLSSIQYIRRLSAEYSGNTESTFSEFINFVNVEQDNDKIVTDQSPFVSGLHAVSLLSVHKAKGLEFDTVYVIDAIEKIWQPRRGGRKPPANLPLQPAGDDMDDYARLMYVAVTRAKCNLVVSYYRKDGTGNDVLPSNLIATAMPKIVEKDTVEPISVLEDALRWPELSTTDLHTLLQPRIESYSLSVTHLLNFLDVSSGGPKHFIERNLLHLPEAKSTSMAYGTAIHDALEYAQKQLNDDKLSIKSVIKVFQDSLNREHMMNSETKRYQEQGEKLLSKLLGDKILQMAKGAIPEQKLSGVFVGEAKLNGKLDLMHVKDKNVVISDYKTGRPLSSFDTQDASQQIKAWRQRTQLIYYALLLKHSPIYKKYRNIPVVGQMIYLEADKSSAVYRQYVPSSEEISYLEQLIQNVWSKIQKLDLPDISHYSADYAGILEFQNDLVKT